MSRAELERVTAAALQRVVRGLAADVTEATSLFGEHVRRPVAEPVGELFSLDPQLGRSLESSEPAARRSDVAEDVRQVPDV